MQMIPDPKDHLCFALDVPNLIEAHALVQLLKRHVGIFKVGLELFISSGPVVVEMVKQSGAKCFLDLKLHDIPETVSRAVIRGKQLGADFMTIHASGGEKMMKAAVEAAGADTKLLGVTALTSMDNGDCVEVYGTSRAVTVSNFLAEIVDADVPGVVCSANEVRSASQHNPDRIYVVPGIRPVGSSNGDQKAVGTPYQAILEGADILVVGRPIRDAQSPVKAAEEILKEIEAAKVALIKKR